MYADLCHDGTWGLLENLDLGIWGGELLLLVIAAGFVVGLTLLIGLAIWATRARQTGQRPSSRESLQARYARGVITREQYELSKQDIG